eukprot:4182567-Amphidinium_carterae.1
MSSVSARAYVPATLDVVFERGIDVQMLSAMWCFLWLDDVFCLQKESMFADQWHAATKQEARVLG